MFQKLISCCFLLTLFLAVDASDARGDLVNFVLEWSEVTSFVGDDTASATGTITLDDSVLLNPGNNDTDVNPFVTSFSITVTGATLGNGTWALSDFESIIFQTDTALDLTQELVGQPTSMDPWGTSSGNGGDFNIFALQPLTNSPPNGTSPFTIHTDNELETYFN